MNIWENTVLTNKGAALQAKLLQGQTLKIKRVTTGTQKVPVVDLRRQTSVTEGGYDLILQPARTEGDRTIIPVLLENRDLKESYELWQVGFYAEDPDEGEILFCLAQASQAKNIPSAAESPGFSITWDFYFNTSNTAPFEVVLDSKGLVNIEQYQIHTDAISGVSGRVENLSSDVGELNSALIKTDIDVNNIKTSLNNKVDKIANKGLSTYDFDAAYKNKVDNYLYDSGWVNCSLGYGIVQYGIIPIQVRRIGPIVHLRGIVKNNTSWQEHNSIITIPAGFRPAYEENFIMQGSGSNRYLLTVPASGSCSATRYSNNTTTSNTVPVSSWICLFATWFTS